MKYTYVFVRPIFKPTWYPTRDKSCDWGYIFFFRELNSIGYTTLAGTHWTTGLDRYSSRNLNQTPTSLRDPTGQHVAKVAKVGKYPVDEHKKMVSKNRKIYIYIYSRLL